MVSNSFESLSTTLILSFNVLAPQKNENVDSIQDQFTKLFPKVIPGQEIDFSF